MIMIHSGLINAWNVAGMNAAEIPKASVWFGLYEVSLVGYQGHVIPVVIAVWFMSTLEKKLHKIVPEIIDLFVTPLVTVLATGYITLTIIGPVFSTVENYVLSGAQKRVFLCSVFTHEITTLFIAVLVQKLVDALGRAQQLA